MFCCDSAPCKTDRFVSCFFLNFKIYMKLTEKIFDIHSSLLLIYILVGSGSATARSGDLQQEFLYEGDIVMKKSDVEDMMQENGTSRQRRAVIETNSRFLWSRNVSYAISEDLCTLTFKASYFHCNLQLIHIQCMYVLKRIIFSL